MEEKFVKTISFVALIESEPPLELTSEPIVNESPIKTIRPVPDVATDTSVSIAELESIMISLPPVFVTPAWSPSVVLLDSVPSEFKI